MTMTTWMKKVSHGCICKHKCSLWFGWIFYTWKWPSSMWLNFIDNSINVINFNELSFIHMVICIHVISMLFTCSCFFLYQNSKMYVVNSNHVNKFHSCVPISSKWFTITHVVNFIQGMRLKHMVQFHPCQNSSQSDKFNHMAQFHSCDQVHPNVSSM
jgi:hypothetical protein